MKAILSFLLVMSIGLLVPSVYADNYSYSPLRGDQSPDGPWPTAEEVREDFEQMSEDGVDRIRIFETGEMLDVILEESDKYNIRIDIGIDLTEDQQENREKIAEIIRIAGDYQNVSSFIVGANELWDKTLTVDELIENLDFANSQTRKNISTINGYDMWYRNHYVDVADHVDFITVNMFYQQDSENPLDAVSTIEDEVSNLERKYEKPILVETGWSTTESSKKQQELFFDILNQTDVSYLQFEWADEFWKDDPVESGYGIVQADREEKPLEPIIVQKIKGDGDVIESDSLVPSLMVGMGGLLGYKTYQHFRFPTADEWGSPYVK